MTNKITRKLSDKIFVFDATLAQQPDRSSLPSQL